MIRHRTLIPHALLVFLTPLTLAGCGGTARVASNETQEGRAAIELRVDWPERSRLIPSGASSIKVFIRRGGVPVRTVVISRPGPGQSSRQVLIEGLPATVLTLDVTAHPDDAGQGTPQAFGSASVRTENDTVVRQSITLESTIERVELSPTGVAAEVGQQVEVVATVFDREGRVVLVGPNAWSWQIQNPAVAQIVAGGNGPVAVVQIMSEVDGDTVLTCTDLESRRSRTIEVTPLSNLGIGRIGVADLQQIVTGYSARLGFNAFDPGGFLIEINPDLVSFESLNPDVLEVREGRWGVARAAGTAQVRARVGPIISDPHPVTVTDDTRNRLHRYLHFESGIGPVTAATQIQNTNLFFPYVEGLAFEQVSNWFSPGGNPGPAGGIGVWKVRFLENGQIRGEGSASRVNGEYQNFFLIGEHIGPDGFPTRVLAVNTFGDDGTARFMRLYVVVNAPAPEDLSTGVVDANDESRVLGFGAFRGGRGDHYYGLNPDSLPSGKLKVIIRRGLDWEYSTDTVFTSPPIDIEPGRSRILVLYGSGSGWRTRLLPAAPPN